ncbi:MAG: ankyrin repeat domain-containing protein [Tatlockia sp.]|nr:ankyrin repeat domain-containing protein [Tatlockia sp.]
MDISEINQNFIKLATSISPKIRCLKKLLIEGADINYQNENGDTALMWAVIGQYDRIAEYLLRQGADPLIKNHKNKIASALINPDSTLYLTLKDYELLAAVKKHDLLVAKTVIDSGALINFKDARGYNALMIATEQNFEQMVNFLILQGADPTLTLSNGQSIFALTNNQTIYQLLKEAERCYKGIQQIPDRKLHRFFTTQF